MEFVLILVISFSYDRSATSQAVLFPTQAACENARQRTEEAFTTGNGKAKAICIPRYLQETVN